MNSRLFFTYSTLRVRLFLQEIMQLHQRFLLVFIYLFMLILSGNDQQALRESIAHLLSMTPWSSTDLLLLIGILLYAWIAAAVVRKSARGGRVRFFAASQPLPLAWERAIRVQLLTVINLVLLVFFAIACHQLIQQHTFGIRNLLLLSSYYLGILGLQLSFLEQNGRLFPSWCGVTLLLMISKGTAAVYPVTFAMIVFGVWTLVRREKHRRNQSERSLGHWQAQWRSVVTRRVPPQLLMQLAYVMTKPALLIYCLLIGTGLEALLFMVLQQTIPLSQKIHVYTSIHGFLALLFSSFFRGWHLQREEYKSWLSSLPRHDSWWLRQDTLFVLSFYLLLAVPMSLLFLFRQNLPPLVPLFVLPIHLLGILVFRSMQRSRHVENGVLLILGSSIWFVLVGYLCDHSLQIITKAMSDL